MFTYLYTYIKSQKLESRSRQSSPQIKTNKQSFRQVSPNTLHSFSVKTNRTYTGRRGGHWLSENKRSLPKVSNHYSPMYRNYRHDGPVLTNRLSRTPFVPRLGSTGYKVSDRCGTWVGWCTVIWRVINLTLVVDTGWFPLWLIVLRVEMVWGLRHT